MYERSSETNSNVQNVQNGSAPRSVPRASERGRRNEEKGACNGVWRQYLAQLGFKLLPLFLMLIVDVQKLKESSCSRWWRWVGGAAENGLRERTRVRAFTSGDAFR